MQTLSCPQISQINKVDNVILNIITDRILKALPIGSRAESMRTPFPLLSMITFKIELGWKHLIFFLKAP